MPHSHYRRLDLFCLRRVSFVLLAVLWMSLLAGSGVRAAAISFAPPVTYNVTGAVGPVTADLDGDGHLDMVGSGALGLYLFYGIGDGTFEAHIDLGIIGGWTTVVDVNGDGRVDIVTGQGNTVGVMLNQGQRSFAPPVAYPVGHLPSGITAGDFNGDGWPDLAVAHHGGNNMGVMLNQGDGTFAPIVFYPGGQAPARIACADFDTDGNLDLAMSNYVSGDVILYFGDGRGSFRVGGSFSSHGMYPAMILTEDLNGDGWPDLATANTFGHSISVFLGNGTGLFGGPDVYPTIQYPHIFASADLDGDGAPDIVAPNNGTGSISILQNRGDGTFLPSVTSPSGGSNTRLLTVGDLNGDGLPDVITGNESSNNFSVLINNTPRPDCAVRSLTLDRAMLLGGSQSGTATVTLTTPAPPGGAVLQLASTNPAITLPATVTIPEGVTSARFTLETTPVTLTRHGAVTASYNGTVQRAAVAVRPPRVQLSGPVPNPVTGGHTATAKVTLEMPAGPGGQTITLASDTPLVVPPVTVTVPADAAEANFSIPTYPVAAPCAVLLQATGPGGASLRLQVESLGVPLPQPEGTASLPIYNPANGHWYQAVQGAALTWAQARDAAAALSYAGLPGHLATVTSANEVQFIVNHVPNSQAGSTHWIGAYQERLAPNYSEPTGGWRWVTGEKWDYTNWNGGEPNNAGGEDFVHWLPAGNWNDLPAGAVIITYLVEYEAPIAALLGIGLSPVSSPSSPTAGGQPVNGTVTLAQPAGPSPVTIYLASDYHHQGAIALPASVTVLAGQNSATFTATVYPVAADTSVVLTAIGPTASASVTVPLAGLGLPLPAVNGTAAPPVYNPANGHWYQAVQGAALTWAQARDAAAALSYAGLAGHLATVTSADEVQFIVTNVPNSQAGSTHWIGGYQDRLSPEYREPMGGWRWVTGEPWSYANWNGGEPNNAGGEDFVHWLPSGNWNDLPAGAVIISYLVEYEAPIPQFAVNQVTITPDPVIGGQSATGTVTLSQAAGPSGISVYLGSSHPEVAAVPPTVLVPAGETTATFPVTTNPVAVPTPVLIGASGPTGSASVSLQVADSGAPLPQVAGARTPPIYNPATGHWYQEVNGGSGLTWAQARSAAAGASYLGYPGHLVTVTSAEEHQFLASHLPHASECWIGLYQDRTVPGYSEPAGGWRWITGEAYSWNHWHGEPNNANGNEDWAVMRGTGSWNDLAAANLSYGYIIEYEAIEGPLLRISTRALDFGSGGVGMMGEARTLTLTNVGTAPLSISEISIDGEAAADFGFSAGGEPGILGPGESRPVTLFFRPTVSGNCVARLTLESNSRGPVEPVTLSGLGERRPLSLLAVTPDSLEFGPEPVGLSGTLIVLLHNTGNLPVNIGNINIQGPNAADFTLPMGSCRNSTLAPGSICLLNIRFSPTGTGTRSATLVIPSDAPLSPQLVLLTGIGTAPLLRLSTDSLSFTVPSTGGSSVAQTVVFTNRGDAPLAIEELVLVGQHAGSFQIVSDSGEESLDPGASRTVRVVFRSVRISSVGRRARITGARIASVSYNAALQIRHNDTRPDSPQQIQLTAVETAAAAPNAPTSLKVVATAASPGPVQLTWNDTSANEAEFVLLRRTGAGLYARIAVLPPNMTSTTDTSAKPGTTYTYIMRAVNSVGVSAWSNEASVTTPAIVPPAAPMPLRATMVSATQVNLSWTDRSSNETEFVLLRKTGNGVYGRIAVLGSNTTQYADTTARPNTSYTYIMRAVNGGGFSSWSNEPSVTTPDGLPLAPTLLRATAVSAGRIELVWTDRSQDETGFVLLRKLGSGLYQRLAVLPANTTTYTDNRIAPNTSYTYIMRATNDRGVSAWTNEPSVTTPTGLPARPTNLRAVAVSATQVNLTWTDTSSNEQQYVLLRKVGSGLYQRVGVVGANTTSFVDTTVGGGTTYTYIMRAVNEFGVSAWSDESSVTTP